MKLLKHIKRAINEWLLDRELNKALDLNGYTRLENMPVAERQAYDYYKLGESTVWTVSSKEELMSLQINRKSNITKEKENKLLKAIQVWLETKD